MTFQEYCLKQWMRKNGVELKICKITDAKVQNYLDEQAKNNAKNNKAEDPEYNLDVREKREKIGKEIKKKLKIIIGNEYKKLVTMIAGKTLLTASNMVFFDLLLERKEDEWKNFVDRRENQLTYQLVQYQLSDIVLEEIIIRGFQSLWENKAMHFSKKAMMTRMQDLLIEEKMELTKSKTWILIEAMYNTITDFDNNYDRKENKAVFDFVDGELESCMEKITYCLETIDYDMAHDMKKEVIRQLKRYEKKNE